MGTVVVSRVRPKNWRLCGVVLSFCLIGASSFSVRAGQGAPANTRAQITAGPGHHQTISGNTLTLTTDARR